MAIQERAHGIAFERKESLGGGFRGRVRDLEGNVVSESPVCATIEEARYWVKNEMHRILAGYPYKPAYRYKPDWMMFAWVQK